MSMIRKNIYAKQREWETAKEKAEKSGFSLGYAIRELIRMWLGGKVEIEPPEEDENEKSKSNHENI